MKVLQFTIPVAHDKSVICQEEKLPYFYPYLHRHLEIQLTWVIEGSGTFIVGPNIYTFRPGDIFCIGSNLPHVFKSGAEYFLTDSEKKIHALTIFFDPSEKLQALFDLPEIKRIKEFIESHATGFKIPESYEKIVSDKMMDVKKTKDIDQLICFLNLLKSLKSIKDHLEPLSTGIMGKVSETEGIRISHVYDYIIQNYEKEIALENVAAIAHLPPHAFCRYFKKQTGYTLIAFLNEVRVNEACKKLTSPDFESVSYVAFTSGFKSITNFNRVFKSIIGKSPMEYLRDYKEVV